MKKNRPFLVYCNDQGEIFEDKSLYAIGRVAWDAVNVQPEDWLPLPLGGSLYQLPKRQALGYNPVTKKIELCTKGWAVAAFIPPGYTSTYLSCYETAPIAPHLSLFCYTAVGWYNNKYYITAIKTEKDIRQDCRVFKAKQIVKGGNNLLFQYPHNRLVKHLVETCAFTYNCPAARNFTLNRWECPIPISTSCTANCLGCISFQPQKENHFEANHERLKFKPTVSEIVEFTVPHLLQAPFPIVSFGQGCEGEPLLNYPIMLDAIKEIRKHTDKGLINLNTNGYRYDIIQNLCDAGLDSIRVSLNSVQPQFYLKYYQPNNYKFEDLIETLKIMRQNNKWTSINYFIFPGFTDSLNEFKALIKFIEQTQIDMIQLRNLNIDPDYYLKKLEFDTDINNNLGIKNWLNQLKSIFPNLKFGYFNPPKERILGDFNKNFAQSIPTKYQFD